MRTVLVAALLCFLSIPAGAGQEPPNLRLHVAEADGRITIEAWDADILDLLEALARVGGTPVSVADGVSGKVTLRRDGLTFEEALQAICGSAAFVYEKIPEGGGWRIAGALAAATKIDAETTPAAGETSQDTPRVLTAAKTPANAGGPSSVSPSQRGRHAAADRPAWKKGELLVRFKPGVSSEARSRLHHAIGATVVKSLVQSRIDRVKLPDGIGEDDAARRYAASDIVENTGKNHLRYPQATPDDPLFVSQWNMEQIGAEALWDITTGNSDIIVAVIDSGVDCAHPDLKDNIWVNAAEQNGVLGVDDDQNGYTDDIYGWDFGGYNGTGDSDPMDIYGHGTHVAGIIGALGNNGIGVSGLSPLVRILPLKVMEDSSEEFTEDAIIEAIDYAIAHGARIVNASFGGTDFSNNEYQAFSRLRDAGIFVSTAAGNYSDNMDLGNAIYPACYDLDNILSVANSDSRDNLSDLSNYGENTVDVAAPGVSILSTASSETPFTIASVAAPDSEESWQAIGMEFAGTTPEAGLTAPLYDCGMAYPDEIPEDLAGGIALIRRGNRDGEDFYFYKKARNVQAHDAVGIIFYNNVVDDFDVYGGTFASPDAWVPAVSVTMAAGEELLQMLADRTTENPTLTVTLVNKPSSSPYKTMSGTSMAAPHVAGLAAVLFGQCPTIPYTCVRNAIIHHVDKVPSLTDKVASGGRINAAASLAHLFPPGDLSADCRIGIEDAILVLRILSGLQSPSSVCPVSPTLLDTNGDTQIGLAEAIFILQTMSTLR